MSYDTILAELLNNRQAKIGVIGLGYVGWPLSVALAERGFEVMGFDNDERRVAQLRQQSARPGHTPYDAPMSSQAQQLMEAGRLQVSNQSEQLTLMNVVIICVPTPLTRHRDPDLQYVIAATQSIASHLRPGQLIVLESTTYPGTTREILLPLLEINGFRLEQDFFLAYSPERENPGHPGHSITQLPKVVGGAGLKSSQLAQMLYANLTAQIIPVSSPESAEAVKLTENIFRSVNIALVNELKLVYEAMGIDIWEIIDAAATKPFGFMPFYPGPGLGGHCIPIDPFYLTWKARAYGVSSRFIELAGEINAAMPDHIVARLAQALDQTSGRGLRQAAILIVGVAYKKNIDDFRESPGLRIMHILKQRGAQVGYYDPFIPIIDEPGSSWNGLSSIPWQPEMLKTYDAAVICTDHDQIDYTLLVEAIPLVIDTRNVCAGLSGGNIVKA